MNLKTISFGHLIPVMNVALTFGIVVLHFRSDAPHWRLFFILFAAVERLYETFYTSREQEREKLSRDWTLLAVVVAYMIAFHGSLYSFYLVPQSFSLSFVVIGFILYFSSLIFRWISIFALKDQWGIHSVNQNRVNGKRELIRSGPYRFMRHPYYFAVCIEIISIPLIHSAFLPLIFAVLVVCPLEIFRGYVEERHLVKTFGWAYLKYKQERGGFIPIKKVEDYDRRHRNIPLSFPNRRALKE